METTGRRFSITLFGLHMYHLSVFLLTFIGYACYHATRKSFSNVKSTIASVWTPAVVNESTPPLHPEQTWSSRKMFANVDEATYFLGGLDTAFMLSYAAGLYISGMIGDRFDSRKVLTIGMCGSALAVFLFGVVSEWAGIYNPVYYMVFWILNGLLQSTGWPNMVAVMGNWFPKSSRGLVLGLWSANASVGNIIGAIIAAGVLPYGYEYAFLVTSLLLFCWGIVTFFCLVPSPGHVGLPDPIEDLNDEVCVLPEEIEPLLSKIHGSNVNSAQNDALITQIENGNIEDKDNNQRPVDNKQKSASSKQTRREEPKALTFLQALKLPGVAMYSLAYASLKLVNYAFFFWLPFYLTTNFSWSQETADSMSIWFDVGGIFGSTVAGLISDCMGKRSPVVGFMLVLSFPSLYVYSVSPDNQVINMILMTICGCFVGGPSNIIGSAITADLGKQSQLVGNKQALATVTGIVDGTGSFGAAIGQLLIPILKIHLGWQNVFYFFMVMMFLSLLCILPILYKDLCARCCRQRIRLVQSDSQGALT